MTIELKIENELTIRNATKKLVYSFTNFNSMTIGTNNNLPRLIILRGPSGVGKTTFLRGISLISYRSIINPEKIELKLDEIHNGKIKEIALLKRVKILKKYFRFAFQDVHLLDDLSANENFRISGKQDNLPPFVNFVNGKKDKSTNEFSGGERKRLEVARALQINKGIIFLDEPLSNLDDVSRNNLEQYLLKFLTDNKEICMFIATHIGFNSVSNVKLEQYEFSTKNPNDNIIEVKKI